MVKDVVIPDPFEDETNDDLPNVSIEEVDAELFGKVEVSPRVVAKGEDIYAIWPDLTQPRRAIPARIRNDWDGDPANVVDMLAWWGKGVSKELGWQVSIEQYLGGGEGFPLDDKNPLVSEYFELLNLAASIQRDGLINPITIIPHGGQFLIETGERRWLAYHLLAQLEEKKYSKIPAIEKAKADVWRQAAENGARKPLNAIGMARQLALLIMALHENGDGVKFDSFETLVLPGEADRRFYAQVADGQLYRIPRGAGQRILDVTGLKSIEQVNQYRRLLRIPDRLWTRADEENWAEGRIRAAIAEVPEADDTLTIVNVSETPPPAPPRSDREGSMEVPPIGAVVQLPDKTPPPAPPRGDREGSKELTTEQLQRNLEEFTDTHPFDKSRYEPVSVEVKMVEVLAALRSLAAVAGFEPETFRILARLSRADIRRLVEEDAAGYQTAIDGLYDTFNIMWAEVRIMVDKFCETLKEVGREME